MLPLAMLSFDTVRDWIGGQFWSGVFIAFALLFTCGLGVPVPEDIPLIIVGAFLCHDAKSWAIAGTLCWLGIMGGDVCLYWLSRRFGRNITRVPIIGTHVTEERIAKVEKLFDKYGVGVVAIGRLLAGIRGAMVICAGVTRYNFLTFLIADGLAAIVSGGGFMLLGYWVGSKINDALIKKYEHWFTFGALGLVAAFAVYLFLKWKFAHKAIVAATNPSTTDVPDSSTKPPPH